MGDQDRIVTIRDIAAAAGVSIGTVSKALTDQSTLQVETRRRVQRIATELGYSVDARARGRVGGWTGTVGILTNDLDGRFSFPVLMGAEAASGAGDAAVFLCDTRGDPIRERHHLRALLSRHVDGIIVVGDRTDPRPSLGKNTPVPIVYAYAPSVDPDDISVVPDDVSAGREAARHVLTTGHTQVAYIAGDRSYVASERRASGVSAALIERGLHLVGGEPLYGTWSEAWGRGATSLLLRRYPSFNAVIAGSDQIARGVLDVLRDSGRNVPRDVVVVGHDNQEKIVTHSRPPLSTMDPGLADLGRRAAELLFESMDGNRKPGVEMMQGRLIPRVSTASESA